MPLGFFGTAICLIVVALAVPLFYALVWPAGVTRLWVFLSSTAVLAVIAGVVAFIWLVAPLKGIGISAAPAGSSGDAVSLDSTLLFRFFIALAALVLVQTALSKVLQHFLAR